jgi:hypothetical protein
MIRYHGTQGEHLIRVDRVLLLRKLNEVVDEYHALQKAGRNPDDDAYARPGQSYFEQCEFLRGEVVRILRRLGLPPKDIARLTSGRRLPRLKLAADAAQNEGDDHEAE